MGIVRNLVVRFKNWYKDLANNVINNMNTTKLTDDSKLRGSSKWKRGIALVGAIILTGTSVPGLAENSEVELTAETKMSDELKGNPNELSEVEKQLSPEAVGVIVGAPSEEVNESVQQERKMFNSMEEFMNFRDSVLAKDKKAWKHVMSAFTTESEEYRQKIINGLFYVFNYNSCANIEKELEESEKFFQSNKSFLFSNYNATLGMFGFCFEQSLRNTKLNVSDFIFDDGDREKFEEIAAPMYDCCKTHKSKGSFDPNQLRTLAGEINGLYDEVNESGDRQITIYLAFVSSESNEYVFQKTKEWKGKDEPSLDSKNANEVANAFINLSDKIGLDVYYIILDYDDIIKANIK